MAFTFNDYGNLNGGILESTISEIELELVRNFDSSSTRLRNYNNFLELIEELKRQDLIGGVNRIFLDGSFCTTKLNPRDIDLVILCKPFNKLGNTIIENGMKIREHFIDFHLDIFFVFDNHLEEDYIRTVVDYLHRQDPNSESEESIYQQVIQHLKGPMDKEIKYWMGQFGFDRERNHKAIISIAGGDL